MSFPTPSFGAPYPTTPLKHDRRGSVLSGLQRSSQSVVPASGVAFAEPIRERDREYRDNLMNPMNPMGMTTSWGQGPVLLMDRSDSIRSLEFHESLPAKSVNQMDMEFQLMKLYDGRKRPNSHNFQESNGTFYSNYISERMGRVIKDYRNMKFQEGRLMSYQLGGCSSSEMKRASSMNLNLPRTGSFSSLTITGQGKQEVEGPVEQVEWFAKENAREHRTDRYDITQHWKKSYPVFRRGQPFFFAVKLASRNMDLARNPVFVIFNFGSNPSIGKSTRVCLAVTGDREFQQKDKGEWGVRVHHQEGNVVTLQVHVAPSAPVGVWTCEIEHSDGGVFRCREDIYILFNPYCSEDPVYLDNEQFRREYILNESGKAYCGTHRNVRNSKWIYAQFSDIILPMVTLFLDRFTEGNRTIIDYSQRGNPVFVSRALAHMIYSKFGIFREPENREDNFRSFNFSGTYSVFEKIMELNFRPVENHHSYLASAVFVTCCRALGIPCRSVTAYKVPLDKTSLNVDVYWAEENERESDLYTAYATWNDVWMRREDILGQTYHGWQALDPNENSFGPAPADAIRKGELGVNFDISHFYSMLNSQFRHFFTNVYPEKFQMEECGRLIVTKRFDRDDDADDDFDDITALYKRKDATDDEKFFIANAMKGVEGPVRRGSFSLKRPSSIGRGDGNYSYGRKEEITAEWDINPAAIGQNVQASLIIQNTSSEMRSIVVSMFVRPLFYGVVGRKMKQLRRQFSIQPNQRESIMLELSPNEYQDRLNEDYTIRWFACIYTRETNQFWASDEDLFLSKPRVNVQVRGSPQVDQDMQVTFTMINPLNVTLTDCYIFYEVAGCTKPAFRRIKDIKPGEMLNLVETILPRKGGDTRVVGVFNSRQLRYATGSKTFTVRE